MLWTLSKLFSEIRSCEKHCSAVSMLCVMVWRWQS